MKTAISIPDRIFDAAERVARRLGISRSELYARAVATFVEDHKSDRVSEELDRVYGEIDSRLDPDVARLQSSAVLEDDW
jgi:metal-responsive CopG/Arc/MetJ family transcriptional regulator